MNKINWRNILGFALVLLGGLFLLDTLGVIKDAGDLFFGSVFLLGGLAFLFVALTDQAQWWALIPGFALIGVGLLFGMDTILPSLSNDFDGPLFFVLLSAPFWIIFLRMGRAFWWALIPAGALATLALVAGADALIPGSDLEGPFLFVGLGLTFFVVGVLPGSGGEMRWAFIPGSILTFMGLLIAAVEYDMASIFFGAAFIVAGLYYLLRSLRPRQEAAQIISTPSEPKIEVDVTLEEELDGE